MGSRISIKINQKVITRKLILKKNIEGCEGHCDDGKSVENRFNWYS